MGCDHLISKATKGPSIASQAVRGGRVCYVEAAQTIDVMFDQLDYLLAHKCRSCAAGCEDCKRLQKVREWLLLPFRETPCQRATSARRARLHPPAGLETAEQ